jgi:hypothetical protein
VTLGSNPNYSVTKTDGTLTVNQKAVTVVANPKSKFYGDANPMLTATVTGVPAGGDAVDYSLATTATTLSGVGSYPITVTLGSNPNYSVTSTDSTLTVNAKAVTVAADAKTKTYGDANPALTATLTGVPSGGDAVNYTLSTTAVTLSGVGSYPITVTLGSNPNYSVTKTDRTLTVNARAVTVAADPKTKAYGDPIPTLTATVNGVPTGGVAVNYSLSTTATATSLLGSYPITVTLGANPNYTVTKTDSTLTIVARDANAAYIGQTVFTTSGSSSTTAQVTLSASVADPDGLGSIANATVTFTDLTSGKVLASGVKVSPVASSTTNTGTANTVVTLSSGQYGAQQYLIEVTVGGQYKNTQQTGAAPGSDPWNATHAEVTVMIPPTAYSMQGTGNPDKLTTAAGQYGDASSARYTVGMKYNSKGTNPQGQVQLVLTRSDGTYYIKSNSITSVAFGTAVGTQPAKNVTIYTKASLYKIVNGQLISIDGGVTLRVDAHEGCTTSPVCTGSGGDTIGFTVLSGKDSSLYYSNNWQYASDTKSWRTVQQPVSGTAPVVIN